MELGGAVLRGRFLEGAGLVQPDRSASGYRKFSEDDVARLRFVLRAQRDQYLPLRVIRQRLSDLDKVGGLDESSFENLNKALGRLERFWVDQILYKL